jgi:heterodisulfide reductase subunit A
LSGEILVVGGGIAGIQASLDLAEMGFKINLIEKDPCIGGRMAQLDKTLPTNDCSICILAPKLSECFRHPNITMHTLSKVQKIEPNGSGFDISIIKKARFVKEDECINCNLCVEECPSKVPDIFDMKMRKRKAIYIHYMQGVPAVMAIDKTRCIHLKGLEKGKDLCRKCEKICENDAIDFTQEDKIFHLHQDAVILATGSKQDSPTYLSRFGYGKFKNVLTGLEYERLISASGPTNGHILRPSDQGHPKTIAFIQCVGSRDIHANSYCSSICCTYATKHAILSREHEADLQSFIFYIDLRAGGKGFQKYIERAKNDYDVKYIRGMVSEIKIDENENPILYYENLNTFQIQQKKVDLVILAASMIAPTGFDELVSTFNVEIDAYKFIRTTIDEPLSTNIPGIFACGCARGPTDIPHSVVEASGAAAKAAEYIKTKQLN